MRIINSNERLNECLKEFGTGAHVPEAERLELPQDGEEESFSGGIEAPRIDVEAIRREAVAAAQTEAAEAVQ